MQIVNIFLYLSRVMKKMIFSMLLMLSVLSAWSQEAQDSLPFKVTLVNKEYQVCIYMNLYDKNIRVPGQDIYGDLPGYFAADRDSRLWLIVDSELTGENSARLEFVNDFGSEDLVCDLKYEGKGRYTLHRVSGSTLKIVVNKKWLKIPKTLEMKVRE